MTKHATSYPKAFPFLRRYILRYKGLSIALLAAIVSGALCAIAAQYALKGLIDRMTGDSGLVHQAARDGVFSQLAVFLGLLAWESISWRLGGWLGSRTVIKIGEDIRLDLFEQVSSRTWRFFNSHASGALVGRITAAASASTAVLRTVVWNLLPPIMDLVGSVFVLALIDWRIGAGLIAVAIAGTWLMHIFGQRGFPLHQAHHRESAEVTGDLADVLANIGLVRAYGTARSEHERLRRRLEREGLAHSTSWMFLEQLRCGHDAAFWVVTAVVLCGAVEEWSRGAITTGGVVVASTLTLRALAGSRELGLSLLGLSQQLSSVSEAVNVLRAPRDEATPAGSLSLAARGPGAVRIKDLWYSSGDGQTLFQGLNLYVPGGQKVGVVGASGAGKSTLLRLIQGLEQPDHGEVLIDGEKLSDRKATDVAFSVVTQEVNLLHRSIAENLLYGRPDAQWDEVLAVARATGCDAFIESFPQGYDTIVGERGIRLSGGQRQRLAIARALLRNAPILLLDEATSALDTDSEIQVQDALLKFAGCRTILAVAHRLSTLGAFDRIIVLMNGRIIQDGSPYELIGEQGYFASIWQGQRREFSDPGAVSELICGR